MRDEGERSTAIARRRAIVAWSAIGVVIVLLALRALGHLSTDLRAMLPRNDPAFTREMDFFARQGAARLMAIEATIADASALPQAESDLRDLATALAAQDIKPLSGDDPAALPRAATVVEEHLPALVTPEDLAALEPELSVPALTSRLDGLRERISRPEESFLAGIARQDVLALAAGAGRVLQNGLGGSRIDGPIMIHADELHALLVLEVPFDPSEMSPTNRLMETIDAAQAAAAAHGVRLEGIGAYRHFRENMAAVFHDLTSSLGVSFAAIAALLYSLIPNVRALLVLHVPALFGVVGALAAVGATGQVLPMPVLAFSAAVLGIAVDSALHVLTGLRAGHSRSLLRPLLLAFATTGLAFTVLLTSSVPGLRTIGIMVIGGLATSLACSLFLLPVITPRLAPRDPWLRVSAPLLGLAQAHPRRNWIIIALITATLGWHLKDVRFVDDLRKYDGSRPETWRVLGEFEKRWSGEYRSSDFIVADDADLDHALTVASAARQRLGLPMQAVEHLLPDRAEQARRLEAWNAFWATQGPVFARNLEAACASGHMRFAAFAPSVERYRPVTAVEPITLETWAGTPIEKLLRGFVARIGDRWQVALPLGKLDKARLAEAKRTLEGSGAWLAIREHIGSHLVEVVQADLTSRGIAILAVILVLVFLIERDWRVVVAQLLPSVLALCWTFGLLAWCQVQLTPFAVLAAAFVIGIGIDSAIFLSSLPRAETLSPVLVASITTIAGVSSMAFATHPMISGMGRVLAIGMTFCLLSCLLVTPSLTPYFRRPPGHPPRAARLTVARAPPGSTVTVRIPPPTFSRPRRSSPWPVS